MIILIFLWRTVDESEVVYVDKRGVLYNLSWGVGVEKVKVCYLLFLLLAIAWEISIRFPSSDNKTINSESMKVNEEVIE